VGISFISYAKNSLDLRPTRVTTSPPERIEFVSQGSTACVYIDIYIYVCVCVCVVCFHIKKFFLYSYILSIKSILMYFCY
jgi:hypothetical protein